MLMLGVSELLLLLMVSELLLPLLLMRVQGLLLVRGELLYVSPSSRVVVVSLVVGSMMLMPAVVPPGLLPAVASVHTVSKRPEALATEVLLLLRVEPWARASLGRITRWLLGQWRLLRR
jgi:hypothetical protein